MQTLSECTASRLVILQCSFLSNQFGAGVVCVIHGTYWHTMCTEYEISIYLNIANCPDCSSHLYRRYNSLHYKWWYNDGTKKFSHCVKTWSDHIPVPVMQIKWWQNVSKSSDIIVCNTISKYQQIKLFTSHLKHQIRVACQLCDNYPWWLLFDPLCYTIR